MKLRILIFAILGGFILQACTCSACADKGEYYMVPDSVREEANKFVISKTGREFFEKYIHFNYEDSKKLDDAYYIAYSFRDLQKDYIDETITFIVDTTGMITDKAEVAGIPEVKKNPEDCVFSLNEEEAKKVAISENFPEGINDWEISFRWSSEFNRYVWHILAVESESGSPENYRGKGEEMIISPSDGNVIARRKWNVR